MSALGIAATLTPLRERFAGVARQATYAICVGCLASLCLLGCTQLNPDADQGTAGDGDPTPYLGTWQMMGTVTTTCSDGSNASQPLLGTVSMSLGKSSDLLRTVTDSVCPGFPLVVLASSARLVDAVVCPPEPASQVTLTDWQVTLGVSHTSATETGSAKTVFLPPASGTCSSLYSTSLLK